MPNIALMNNEARLHWSYYSDFYTRIRYITVSACLTVTLQLS